MPLTFNLKNLLDILFRYFQEIITFVLGHLIGATLTLLSLIRCFHYLFFLTSCRVSQSFSVCFIFLLESAHTSSHLKIEKALIGVVFDVTVLIL